MNQTRATLVTLAAACLAAPAWAGSHLWVIHEVFSNEDGSIQFIEMMETDGAANEIFLAGKHVRSDVTGKQYTFTQNLPPNSTANAHLLLATQCFAELPGAPTPDYIIPENFFAIGGDTIRYWMYPAATLTFDPGELPLDGVSALHQDGTVAVNSPTNFAEAAGSVTAPCHPADLDADGTVGITDFLGLLAAWGPQSNGCPPDLDGGGVGITDFLLLLAAWGPCS